MRLTLLVVLVGLTVPLSSEAGILSLLSKSGNAARVGSSAVKLSRAARLAKVATGVSSVVVAERAAASMVGLAGDASRAGYLARGASGELMLATSRTAPAAVDDLGRAVSALAEPGLKPRLVLDPSVAATPEALASLPLDAELAVVEGTKQFPVKRVNNADGTSSFLVDHGGDLVDLADYASQFAGDDEEPSSDSDTSTTVISVLIVVSVVGVWKLLSKK